MEYPPQVPGTAEEWENEVYLTKVRDRLLLLRNKDEKKFLSALAAVEQSDEFLTYGPRLEFFVIKGGEVAKQFVARLGINYDLLVSRNDVSPDELIEGK